MASHVISVNRKKYAVGLFWQPIGAGFTARNYAKNLARNVDRKFNLYTEYRTMIGVGARRNGLHVGMLSAAVAVMEAFSEYTSFVAVFQNGKQFYLVAARNGIVLEDKLFDSEDEARAEYVKLSEIPDWGAFFAPGTWGMPRSAERNLADVLVSGRVRASMHLISHFSVGLWSVVLFGLFALGLGWIFYDSVMQAFSPRPKVQELDPELVAEYKRQIEEKSKELDQLFEIEKTPPPEPIVMPYEFLPDVAARAKLCYRAMEFLMQPIPGWVQLSVECGEEYASVNMMRDWGTLETFYVVAAEKMPGVNVQQIDDDTLRVQATLPKQELFASQDERDAETIILDVVSKFQGIDTDVTTEFVVDTLTNGVDVANVNIVEVAAQSKLAPEQFMKIFDDFGGVYLMRVSWDVRKRFWNYEVIIYAK